MDVRERIRENVRVTDESTIDALMIGLHDASGYQNQLQGIYDHGITFKSIRESMTRLCNALDKLARGTADTDGNLSRVRQKLAEIPKGEFGILDTVDKGFYWSEAWSPNSSRFERIALTLGDMPEEERKQNAARLCELVQAYIGDLRTPGRAGARMQAKRYTMGIQCLMHHFEDALPDCAISSAAKSRFYKYVETWMQIHTGKEREDITRHIDNAFDDLKHWKKLIL